MKKLIACFVVMIIAIAFTGNAGAYEGETKLIAAMNLTEKGELHQPQSALSSLNYEGGATKLVVRFLHRMPAPTLSLERIREEKPGPSVGTKNVVLFQKGRGF